MKAASGEVSYEKKEVSHEEASQSHTDIPTGTRYRHQNGAFSTHGLRQWDVQPLKIWGGGSGIPVGRLFSVLCAERGSPWHDPIPPVPVWVPPPPGRTVGRSPAAGRTVGGWRRCRSPVSCGWQCADPAAAGWKQLEIICISQDDSCIKLTVIHCLWLSLDHTQYLVYNYSLNYCYANSW